MYTMQNPTEYKVFPVGVKALKWSASTGTCKDGQPDATFWKNSGFGIQTDVLRILYVREVSFFLLSYLDYFFKQQWHAKCVCGMLQRKKEMIYQLNRFDTASGPSLAMFRQLIFRDRFVNSVQRKVLDTSQYQLATLGFP